jgi:DNA-binding IscR family transcriptional regulator
MSMRLTKDVVICIDLLTTLRNRPYPARLAELAPQLNTTHAFLKQIVHKLKKSGLLKVQRGPGGGIMRASNEDISVLAVFKALGRPITIAAKTKEAQILQKVEQVLSKETC